MHPGTLKFRLPHDTRALLVDRQDDYTCCETTMRDEFLEGLPDGLSPSRMDQSEDRRARSTQRRSIGPCLLCHLDRLL